MDQKCINCANLIKWCENVWLCKVKKNTIPGSKLNKPKRCDDWRKNDKF